MATGYTSNLYEGKPETLREFLEHLARGMGAYIMQRDDDPNNPPKPREVSEYYYDHLVEAQRKVESLAVMTDSEKQARFQEACQSIKAENERHADHVKEVSDRYYDRLHELEALDWSNEFADGPVGEFFQGYRKFVFEQMHSSIKHDCDYPLYQTPVPEDVDSWYAEEVKRAARALSYTAKSLADELDRVTDQNTIHRALMKWLDSLES